MMTIRQQLNPQGYDHVSLCSDAQVLVDLLQAQLASTSTQRLSDTLQRAQLRLGRRMRNATAYFGAYTTIRRREMGF